MEKNNYIVHAWLNGYDYDSGKPADYITVVRATSEAAADAGRAQRQGRHDGRDREREHVVAVFLPEPLRPVAPQVFVDLVEDGLDVFADVRREVDQGAQDVREVVRSETLRTPVGTLTGRRGSIVIYGAGA